MATNKKTTEESAEITKIGTVWYRRLIALEKKQTELEAKLEKVCKYVGQR